MKKLLSLLLTLCLACTFTGAMAEAAVMQDGAYTGVGAGFGGDLTVSMTVEGGAITALEVVSHSDTAGICDPAIAQLPEAIIAAQSAAIDVIAGATMTSKGILAAAQDAIDQAAGVVKEAAPVMEDPDVLVVGAGIAGMCAAIEAAEQGAKVLILEKTGNVGGTMGGGTLIGVDTSLQHAAGIEGDTPESLFNDFVRLNAGYMERTPDAQYTWNEDLGRYFAENCGQRVEWLVDLGVNMTNPVPNQPTLYEPLSVPRITIADRSSITEVVLGKLQPFIDAGQVSLVLSTPATDLIAQDGVVVGAVDANGTQYLAKATILCTGGYGYSEELVTRYNLQNFTTTCPAFATGDGMLMAERVGATLRNMDFLTTYAGGLKTPEGGLTRTMSIRVKDFPHIVFVNANGERFVDELGNEDGSSYDEITSWWKKGDNKVYILLDQAMIEDLKAKEMPVISGDKDWSKFEDLLAKGDILFSGATLTEAAEKAGINGENLEATIARYNTFAENGVDEDFGRTRLMTPFTGGTYYIFETTPYIMITAGGPDMNDKAQLLTESGDVIPGLYQAGEIVGMANAFGRTTIGGVGNTGNLVWGQLAGRSAAQYALGLE